MATTYTLSGNLRDLLGGVGLSRVRAWVEASEPTVVDKAANTLRLGKKQLNIDAATGAFVATDLPATGDSSWMPQIAGLRLVIEYRDDTPGGSVETESTNYFPLTKNTTLAEVIQRDPNFIAAFQATDFAAGVASAQAAAASAAASATTAQTARDQAVMIADPGLAAQAVVQAALGVALPPAIAAQILNANPAIAQAAAALAQSDAGLIRGAAQYSNESAYAWVDQNDKRSWIEIGADGGPTAASAALLLAKLASGVNGLIATQISTIPVPVAAPASSGVGFVVVDQNGNRSEIEVGEDGRFAARVIDSIARRLPVSTTADPVAVILPATMDLLVGQTYRFNYAQVVANLGADHRIKVSGPPVAWGDFGTYWQYTPASAGTWTLTVTIRDRTGAVITAKDVAVTVRAVPASAATVKHMQIGDSITAMSEFVRLAIAAIPGATATAPTTRPAGVSQVPTTRVLGRSGWALDTYFTSLGQDATNADTADSDFLFPTTLAGAKYWGNSTFWRRVVSGVTSFQTQGWDYYARGNTTNGAYIFSASTGYPLSPADGDVILDPTKAAGSKWQIYTASTTSWGAWATQPNISAGDAGGDIAFDFPKFMARWTSSLPSTPTTVGIFLGTNGPATNLATPPAIDLRYDEVSWSTWKRRMDLFIASVRAWSPTVPILLFTVIERGRQVVLSGFQENEFDGDTRMREMARRVIAAYDTPAALANKVHVVPLLGVVDKANIYDTVHPGPTDPLNGHAQISPWLAGKLVRVYSEGL